MHPSTHTGLASEYDFYVREVSQQHAQRVERCEKSTQRYEDARKMPVQALRSVFLHIWPIPKTGEALEVQGIGLCTWDHSQGCRVIFTFKPERGVKLSFY